MNMVESRFPLFAQQYLPSCQQHFRCLALEKLGSKASSKFVLLRSRVRSALALVWAAQNPGWNPAQGLA
jgi:hypothetical protein